MAYTLSAGAPNYWYDANPPRDAGTIGPPGRGLRARYSFIADGERRWHRPELARLKGGSDGAAYKAIVGQSRP